MTLQQFSPCTNPVAAGVAISSDSSICPSANFDLDLTGASTGNGISFQWQSSTDGITYSNLTGGTALSNITTSQQVGSYYRAIVSCSSGIADTSSVVQVGINPFMACYCTSQANFASDEDVVAVSISNLNNVNGCGLTGGGNSVVGQYSDYTGNTPALLTIGNSYPMSVTIDECDYSNWGNGTVVWIDWNQNGSFSDPGEIVLTSSGQVNGPNVVIGNVTVPANAVPGTTMMRVVVSEFMSPANMSPCGPYSWGETEDYLVQIIGGTNYGCISGSVFCDNNNNGVIDSNDVILPNAPLILNYAGLTQIANSSSIGNYFFAFQLDTNATSATVSVDAAWLAQNGIQYVSNTMSTSQLVCDTTSPQLNFPVNCDSSTIQYSCAIGWVFCDSSANGVLDSGEIIIPNAPVVLSNGVTVYTDSNGVFSYSGALIPSQTITATIPNWWLNVNGYVLANNSFTVSSNCDSTPPIYFGVNCSPVLCSNLKSLVSPWIGYFQNYNNKIKLKWGNMGPNPTTGYVLTLTFPAAAVVDQSTINNSNYVISGNTITWNFGPDFSYFNSQDIITFSLPNGIPNGTSHTYSSTITATGATGDCDSTNNDGALTMLVGNSYDPNDKAVSHPEIINPDTQEELTYVIRFQNTGTAPAQDVYIIDSLSQHVDWTTLKVIDASHYMQLIDLGNGVTKFNFPGIWLPDSTTNEPMSHGHVVFSVKENIGNQVGTSILNTGYIYFDWNAPIITNTTVNTNAYLGLDDLSVNDVSIYPNPFNNNVLVSSSKRIDNISVVDITGKVVFETEVNGFNANLELQDLKQGIYLVRISSGTEVSTKRMIKR